MKLMQKKGICSLSFKKAALYSGVCASILATATVQAANVTMSVQQSSTGGLSWDTAESWSNGLSATETVAADAAATFELLPGARLRTPPDSVDAVFPGSLLTVDGNGVFVNNPAAGDLSTSEIRFKQSAAGGRVTFPKLIMNGGQLDTGNDGTVTVSGQIEIAKNTPIYNDNANDRGYVLDAFLTGTNNIEYRGYNKPAYDPLYSHNLDIAGNTNTFSGKWNVVVGTLLGTGTNALGTNDITVGPQGAVETTYDINNPSGSLNLQGRMFLHQTNTFRTVTIGTTPLAAGDYTFADLSAQFPDQFPSVWTPQIGAEAFAEGSGKIIVLQNNSVPVAITVPPANARVLAGQTATFRAQITGPATWIKWFKNGVEIPGAITLTFTTEPVTAADNNANYKVVVSNNVNSVEASAKLTIGQLVLTQGVLKDEIWVGTQYDKDNVQVTTDSPSITKLISTFETSTNQGDNYVEKVSGWFTPTVTGEYIFFINGDDDSNLYLSPDATPERKQLIAMELEWTAPRQWLDTTRRGDPVQNRSDVFTGGTIHLEKGVPYYIEAIHHEGTGDDNLSVTFIVAGSADPANGTAPAFTSAMLSTMAIDSGDATPAQIKNVTFSDNAIHFAFPSQAGLNYTVEYKTSLTDATWTTLTTKQGTGFDVTVDDKITATTRFYRVAAR